METHEHLVKANEEYYPEAIVVFMALMLIGCVVGVALGITCTLALAVVR